MVKIRSFGEIRIRDVSYVLRDVSYVPSVRLTTLLLPYVPLYVHRDVSYAG